MGLFIRLLLIVVTVKSQAELVVAFSGNQRTVSCELDISSKIDELKNIVENYLNMVNIELINTKDQVKELKVAMTDNQETVSSELEDTRRRMDELHVAVSGNQETVSSGLENTRRKMDELQVTVSGNQETVSSELENSRRTVYRLRAAVSDNQETVSSDLENTRRKMDELQVAVSGNQETISSELEDTRRRMDELQVAVSGIQRAVSSELDDTGRKMDELQVAVSGIQGAVSSELDDTGRKMDKLQVALSGIQETVSGNQATASSEIRGIRRQLEELHVSVTALLLITDVPKDCSQILKWIVPLSGVYTVQPLDSGEAFQVYCDMETDGGGWTVFQRRKDGSVDFYLDFASYSRGFGNVEGEFWLGNDNLYRLTDQSDYELRVDLTAFDDDTAYAVYDVFFIADVSDNYRLTVGSYSGTAGDSLSEHSNHVFTTKDRDNDERDNTNCAEQYHGAWWYRTCHRCNLNGIYFNEATSDERGTVWYDFQRYRSLKTTEMKIRNKADHEPTQ